MSKRQSASSRKRSKASIESDAAFDAPSGLRPDGEREGDARFRRFKIIASVLILFHLMAVALPPLAFQTSSIDGPSPLVGTLIRPFAGYGQFLHMDRGYAFFAPDPGASHLIQAASAAADGTLTEQMYPDREDQWPRLLYHRHFMLSEYLNEVYWPPGPPDEMFETDKPAAELWQQRRGRYEYIRQSMVDHLKSENEGRDVAIRRIEHGLPGLLDFVEEPIALNDPRLYNVLLDQPIFSDEMAPATSTEEIPSPPVAADSPANDVPQPSPANESATAEPER